MEQADPSRIRTLDLIRGVAVLGILAVNVASFAAPTSATYSPNLPQPGSPADNWAFAFTLVFFEGKMRALFSMLFGASLLLFIERRDAAGKSGGELQIRRLFWLALFGWLHFLLLWDGDILFLYACVGIGALAMRQTPAWQLVVMALLLFGAWQVWGISQWAPSALREQRVAAGTASPADRSEHARIVADSRADDAEDINATLSSWGAEVAGRQADRPAYPLLVLAYSWGETLPYMMIGMALFQSGFFAGGWTRRRTGLVLLGAVVLGMVPTLAFTAWAQARGYPELAMHLAINYLLAVPHLLIALGYAALLVLAAPALLRTWPGRQLEAAGRMAFSNYIGTTVLMCFIFYGWGLGLFGQYGAAGQWLFVLLGWAAMLAWSAPWLARFRQGPLEWLWRSLTEGRILPLRRSAT